MTHLVLFYIREALAGALVTPNTADAVKLKAVFESIDPGNKANVHHLGDLPAEAREKALAAANEWLTANGYDPLPADAKLVS